MTTLPVLNANYVVRPCTLDDLEAVMTLMNICEMAATGQTESTHEGILSHWQRPNFDQAKSQRVVITTDGKFVGWVELESSKKIVLQMGMYVHPDYETEGIGEYLYAWAENLAYELSSEVPTETRIVMRSYTRAQNIDVWYSALLRAAGMQLIRHSWRMEMALDRPQPIPQWAEGITLKIYDGVSDKRPICAVRRTAFQDQFGYVDRPFEEEYARWLHHWEHEGIFLPELWFLAMDGETIAGICLCRPNHNGDEDHGWVATLGVLREYRRRGIAEALLHTAFDALYKMGKKQVGLGVDASSLTGAATLYKRVGMHVDKQFDLYEKELRAGIDLTKH
ncbi:MAG: GNAT family N-acetyltransferase [Anaerolineaceae bacterium]|nr:GNAT family N-acetyltransferase [Anaerolineaceae bacterium]